MPTEIDQPLVVVLSLGGTIAMAPGAQGVVPVLTGDDLVKAVPGLDRIARIEARTLRGVPGASLCWADIDELAHTVDEVLDAGASGVVVTTGTDTLEETSYAMDLLVRRREPVVFTGAMRHPSLPGADGPANLHAAVMAAASGLEFGGVVVVMANEIHAARAVTKAHSIAPAAFTSPASGPIGLVNEDRILGSGHCGERHPTISRDVVRAEVSVPLVTIGFADDGRLLAAAHGADGLVLEAPGGGHVPSWLVPDLASLAREMPVVLCSRTGSGAVLRSTYGFPGSETDLLARGLLTAEPLPGTKARILLMSLLRAGLTPSEISAFLRRIAPSPVPLRTSPPTGKGAAEPDCGLGPR